MNLFYVVFVIFVLIIMYRAYRRRQLWLLLLNRNRENQHFNDLEGATPTQAVVVNDGPPNMSESVIVQAVYYDQDGKVGGTYATGGYSTSIGQVASNQV